MAESRLTIGRLANETGCKVQTIRFYEQAGLLPRVERSSGNQRLYRRADLDRLAFIRHCRDLGFSLDAVRQLLALADRPELPCEEADAIARRHLDDVDRRIARLESLRVELRRMLEGCAGRTVAECRIVSVLADHGQCASPHLVEGDCPVGRGPSRSSPAVRRRPG